MSREIKCLILGGAALAASLPIAFGQACAAGSAQEINGNWYCQAVSAISYFNFGTPGTYQRVTAMGDGECATAPQSYSGGIAPLDEDVGFLSGFQMSFLHRSLILIVRYRGIFEVLCG